MNFSKLFPKTGSLLLSEPFMLDPNFERSVVLLCEHHPHDGTVGLILNHRSNLYLKDIIDNVSESEFPIYIGGPVQENALFFIHRSFEKLQSGDEIVDGLYWGGDFDRLLLLIQEKLISPQEVKFFIGYSGWNPNQLDEELKENSWTVSNSFDIGLTFLTDGEDLWKQALINMGPRYAHVANFPKDPYLN